MAAITTMAASEVPVAMRSSYPSHRTSSGTITTPPPTPNRPLNSPATLPVTASFSMRAAGMSGHTKDVTSALSSEALAPLRNHPAQAAILLDIDGPLSPIVDQPSEAHVSERTRQLLIQIARRYGLVACVSGRPASEARAMVAIGTIFYLGSHGAELLRAGWTTPMLDPRLQDWARQVHEF